MTTPDYDDVPRTAGGSPVSAHGLSWKAAAALASILVTVAASWAHTNAKLDHLIETSDRVAEVQIEHSAFVAGAKVRLAALEGDVEHLKHGRE